MKQIGAIGLFVLGFFLWLLPLAGEAAAISVDCNVRKLQTAIDRAKDSTTILVTGTCNENVVIDQTKDKITLYGGGTATIHGVNVNNYTVDVLGKGITIRGFIITGGYNGIQVERGGTALIDGNNIHDTQNNGISVGQNSSADIINNTIQNNTNQGINVQDNASAHIGFVHYYDTISQPNTVQGNGNHGINVQRSSSATIVGNAIQNNTNNGIRVTKDSHADISDNTINGNGSNGIRVNDNSGVNLGNDTGTTIFDLPNATTVNNLNRGINCDIGGYADGRLGTLNGVNGATVFDASCINSLLP